MNQSIEKAILLKVSTLAQDREKTERRYRTGTIFQLSLGAAGLLWGVFFMMAPAEFPALILGAVCGGAIAIGWAHWSAHKTWRILIDYVDLNEIDRRLNNLG